MNLQKYIIRLKVDAHGEKAGRCIGLSVKAAKALIDEDKAELVSKTYSIGALRAANEVDEPKPKGKSAKVVEPAPVDEK